MADTRSMLCAQVGDEDVLYKLSGHAFMMLFEDVIEYDFGPVDVQHVANTLGASDGFFVDALSTLGQTQEAVIDALEMLVERRIRAFVLDEGKRIMEITPEIVQVMRAR